MPYRYNSIVLNRRNIDEDGNALLSSGTSVWGTLGAYIEIPFTVTASGTGADLKPETVFDRMFSFRWKFYTQEGSAPPAFSQNGFRLKTGLAIAAAQPMEFFSSNGTIAETNQNFSATLQVLSSTQISIVFRFYCTSEDPNFAPYSINNLNRLLASRNLGNHMELEPGGQFELGVTGVSIVTLVSDGPITVPPSAPYITVTRGTTATNKEYYTTLQMKWPGRNRGNTAYELYLDEFDVKNLNGDILAAKTHKDTALPHQARYDDNFTVTASSLSSFEDNIFRFNFNLDSGLFTATTVRVFLLRTDKITNSAQFLIDYDASIAIIPASDTTQDQISGAIYAPASFTNGADYEVSFRVPGSSLQFGGTYRAIAIMYGTAVNEIYCGISHELTANDHPNLYPKADIFFADYFEESVLRPGLAAYHSAYRARISVDKTSLAPAFAYYGLTGDFSSVQYIRGDVVSPGTESPDNFTPESGTQPFLWVRSSGLLRGQDLVDTSTVLGGAFTGFIDEQWLPYADQSVGDYYASIQWEIGVESYAPNGEFYLLKCQYRQNIVARRWENEAGQPTPPAFTLEMSLFRTDETTPILPGTERFCGQRQIIALVEKSNALAGGGLDAYCIPETYSETNTAGDTVNGAIKQRRGAFLGLLPASTNPQIDAYDAEFSDNVVMGSTIDDAGILLDLAGLNQSQRHWLVALARPIYPNGIPFLATAADVDMVRDGSNMTTVTADFTAWRAAFEALLTGASTVYNFRINNFVTQNFAGVTAGGSGNPSTDPDICEVIIDHKKSPIKVIEVVYEIDGTMTATGHDVRFMVRKQFTLPTSAGSISGTIVQADWMAVDFDF